MNSYPNNLKTTKISTFSKKEEKRYWKGMRENRKIAPRFDSSRRFISTIRSMAERGKKRGGIPSNRGSRSKRRGVEFTERRGGEQDRVRSLCWHGLWFHGLQAVVFTLLCSDWSTVAPECGRFIHRARSTAIEARSRAIRRRDDCSCKWAVCIKKRPPHGRQDMHGQCKQSWPGCPLPAPNPRFLSCPFYTPRPLSSISLSLSMAL